MSISDPYFFEVLESQRDKAIEELNQLISNAQRHIEMLSLPLEERSTSVSNSIAQQENGDVARALRFATEHDTLLRMHRRYN